ncbi:MAG: ROK family protein [Clostridiales bacterium]|nr:ROK family protein [Clostridiales bacterium]
MTYHLMLDVGGTNIKAGILDRNGKLYRDEILSFPAKAKEGEREIFENFVEILNVLTDKIPDWKGKIGGVGMAFPGPFDYIRGISLMRGLDKYDSIYGIPIADRIRKDFRISRNGIRMSEVCPFIFIHDVRAFALGEMRFGMAGQWKRVMYLCMGTGAGSAFSENNRILCGEEDSVPENGWIYNTFFKESIIDDYLSIRGLEALSGKILGTPKTGQELFELCSLGDPGAVQVYREFGEWMKEAMMPFLDSFGPQGFILGGQIAKSFAYFGEAFTKACKERGIQIRLAENMPKRTLEGLYIELQKRVESEGEEKGC